MKRSAILNRKKIKVFLILYQANFRLFLVNMICRLWLVMMRFMEYLKKHIIKLANKEFQRIDRDCNKMDCMLAVLFSICFFIPKPAASQFVTWAFHTDLPFTQTKNSVFKCSWNYAYADKLKEVKENREKTLEYLVFVEEVQQKIFNTLTNVDGAIKDGKTLWALRKKMPEIFTNLEKSVQLAAGKPHLLTITYDMYNIFYQRCLNLTTYLKEVILKSDEQLLIDPVRRHKLVYDVYSEVNVLYHLSKSILDQYRLKTLQDAIDKVIPVSTFYNVDKMMVQDILRKMKF